MIRRCFFACVVILYLFIFPLIASDYREENGLYFHPGFEQNHNPSNDKLAKLAEVDRLAFWQEAAGKIDWFQRWNTLMTWNPPYSRWYVGGVLNACYNCLDRHLPLHRDKLALIWVSENGEERRLTYSDLHTEVCKLANVLKLHGVKKGDCVAVYMPMTPEAITGMLACARIGAMHSVIFGGTGSKALKERLIDARVKLLITADEGMRKGKRIPYKAVVDEILSECAALKSVIVYKRTGAEVAMQPGRDFCYQDEIEKVSATCAPEWMDSEDPLFVLYTSGTTGKPKGILHTTGGYMVGVNNTFQWVFDLKPDDVYWCTADVGWITGHSYIVYGPMSCGATQIIYEGSFDYPSKNQTWEIIQKYKPTIFYTAPTLIRMFMKWGTDWEEKYDVSSLRLLGSIGEPLNPETWQWFHDHVGKGFCPIVDTWFQTETGAFVLAPLPGITPLKPGSVSYALPGYTVEILDDEGRATKDGYLAIITPYPSMLRGILNDPERFWKTYWEKWNGKYYYAGDFANTDENNYFWVRGRADEVLKVAGHRIGTAEVENAILDVPGVAEAAVVGVAHPIKGQAIIALVILKEGCKGDDELKKKILNETAEQIGKYGMPEIVHFVSDLPKTKSGKILRRVVANLIEEKPVGDLTSIENIQVMDDLSAACSMIRSCLGRIK